MNDLCKICGKSVKNISSLSKHIKYNHQNILLKNYYDSYLKKDGDGFCAICKRETIYIGLGVGYQITCSRKCGCIYHRKQLKKNTNKYNIFLKKVAKNQKEIWKKREDTDEKQNILNKVMTTIRHNIENMTEAERKEKFGWLNKLDEHEKTLKVKEILNKSLFKWYNESFEEEKQLKYDKRIQTMIKNGKCIDKNFLSDWDQYKINVKNVTAKNYKKYKNLINPNNLKRSSSGYGIDHIVSIFDGFKNKISPEIVGSPVNLQMLTTSVNSSKNRKSWMSIEELLEKWQDTIINLSLNQNSPKNM